MSAENLLLDYFGVEPAGWQRDITARNVRFGPGGIYKPRFPSSAASFSPLAGEDGGFFLTLYAIAVSGRMAWNLYILP